MFFYGVLKMKAVIKKTILILSLGLMINITVADDCDCEPPYYTKQTSSNYYGDCPCFNSSDELRDAIGDNKLPTSCMLNKTFTVLTGGVAKFTSRDSGTVFNCYFQNMADKDKLMQIVEYGKKEDVAKMHLACNNVVREFASKYKLSCK